MQEGRRSVRARRPRRPELAGASTSRIAYEDEHLLVVDKPAGVVVHPGAGHAEGTLAQALLAHGAAGGEEERAGIVHRLDRDTSGLLVVARSPEAHGRLQALVRARGLEREYLALVRGKPRSRRGRIEAPIGRDRREPTRQCRSTPSRRARRSRTSSSRSCSPATRSCASGSRPAARTRSASTSPRSALPVVGDPVYGVTGELELARQFLHAARLAFPHPFGGERVDVASPLPPDLAEALERAR